MSETLVIQLLSETVNAEGNVERQFRWGYVDEFSNWPDTAHSGSAEALLSAMVDQKQSPLLLLPGSKVVTAPVAYSKKEARHFLKMLPYQLEEDVLGSVDDLHFAVGNKTGEVVTVGYVDRGWFEALWQWFTDNNITVTRCIADFQCVQAVGDELLLWVTEGGVLGHRANGLGFSVSETLAQPFLKDLLQNQQDPEHPWQVRVYVSDAETKEIIDSHFMPPVEYDVIIGSPPMDLAQTNQLNFCSGVFGQKLPVERWWQEARPLALLAAAAVAIFFISAFADIYLLKKRQAGYETDMLSAYREVVPRGPATDPVRRLNGLLGSNTATKQESQSVYLLSQIAPALDRNKINLVTLNYSNREQSLRINVQAESFSGIEQLRQQLDQQGLVAELQSSNAAEDGFQARLRVALKESRRG